MHQPSNDTQVQLKIKPRINFLPMKLKLKQSKIKKGSKDRLFLVLGYIQIQATQIHQILMNDAVFCFALNNNSTNSTLAEHKVESLHLNFSSTFSVLTFSDIHHVAYFTHCHSVLSKGQQLGKLRDRFLREVDILARQRLNLE